MDNNFHQEVYARNQGNPHYDRTRRDDSTLTTQGPVSSDYQKSVRNQDSDDLAVPRQIYTDDSKKVSAKISFKDMDLIGEETFELSLSRRNLKFGSAQSFSFANIPSASDMDEANDVAEQPMSRMSEPNEDYFPSPGKPAFQRIYSLNRRKSDISRVPLPQSAASFYNGDLPQVEVVESCESIHSLNHYLKATRDFIEAGAPGKFLHAVISQEVTDVGAVTSTIMYAFYLNETLKNAQLCTIPVINMTRADLNSHTEITWLLDSCHINVSSLVFIDEIDLSYYYVFGSLKLVLLNGNKLSVKHEALKEAIVEVYNCKKDDSIYPWVETVTVGKDCSCCTLVAEKFSLASPEILAGQGFSRLLLAGILLDTENLKNPRCTLKDKYMTTLLIYGAGRFGCNGLYQILRYKMYDISELKVGAILRKDFKRWTRVGKPENAGSRLMVSHIGMSSIGIPVGQLLSHADSATQDIVLFQQSEKLRLLMVVSGYYDERKNFKREILVSAESVELMRNLLHFFNANAAQLPLKVLHQPGLRDELKAFEIDNQITSRKTIERLLEEFGGPSRR